jgi:hypothetical protein
MTKAVKPDSGAERGAELNDDELIAIRSALAGLRFGSVHIVVQDGVIVQIDRTEKRRLRNGQGTA